MAESHPSAFCQYRFFTKMLYNQRPETGNLHTARFRGQHFFYMACACCVNVYMVSVHTSST